MMADIDVVPKRGGNTWVWIGLAIVAVLVILAFMGVFSRQSGVSEYVPTSPHIGVIGNVRA